MKRASDSRVEERDQITTEREPHMRSVAGILGPPARLPDPSKSWDELVEEAAAAEYLAGERRSGGEPVDDDD